MDGDPVNQPKFCSTCGQALHAEAEICPGCGVRPPKQGLAARDEWNLGMLCHLLGIFTGFIGPLVLWLVKKDQSPFLDRHGKEALNFQITLMLGYLISAILAAAIIGFLMIPLLLLADITFCIVAAVKASKGEFYRYPLTLRLLK
jgi:uncharacterized protein